MKYIAVTAGNIREFKELLKIKGAESKEDNYIGFKDDTAYVYVTNVLSAAGYTFTDKVSWGTDYENSNIEELHNIIDSRLGNYYEI